MNRPKIPQSLYARLVDDLIRDGWTLDPERSYLAGTPIRASKTSKHPGIKTVGLDISLHQDALFGVTIACIRTGQDEPNIAARDHADLPDRLDEAWVLSELNRGLTG